MCIDPIEISESDFYMPAQRPTPAPCVNLPLYPDMRDYDCRMISNVIIQTMHTKQLKHYKREFASSVLKSSGREKRKKEIMNENCDLGVN